MLRFLSVLILLVGLVGFGCDSAEQAQPQAETVVKEQPPVIKEKIIVPVAETTPTPTADKTVEATEAATETTAAIVDQATTLAEKAANVTEETTVTMEPPGVKFTQEAEEAIQTTTETATGAMTKAEEQVATAITDTTKKVPSPEQIVLQASYGNITFPHNMHAEAYDCTTCHGAEAPGKFELTKEVAHPLCKDCHKKEGAGPTGCRDCHVK